MPMEKRISRQKGKPRGLAKRTRMVRQKVKRIETLIGLH